MKTFCVCVFLFNGAVSVSEVHYLVDVHYLAQIFYMILQWVILLAVRFQIFLSLTDCIRRLEACSQWEIHSTCALSAALHLILIVCSCH